MSGGAFPEGLCTLQVNSPCHSSVKHCLLDTYLLLTAPFRGMLLTLRGGPESLAPKTHGVPVTPHGVSTFLHAAFTAHGLPPPNPCQAAADCCSMGLLLPGCVPRIGPLWKASHGQGGLAGGRSSGAAPLACGWPLRFSCLETTQGTLRSLLRQGPRYALPSSAGSPP